MGENTSSKCVSVSMCVLYVRFKWQWSCESKIFQRIHSYSNFDLRTHSVFNLNVKYYRHLKHFERISCNTFVIDFVGKFNMTIVRCVLFITKAVAQPKKDSWTEIHDDIWNTIAIPCKYKKDAIPFVLILWPLKCNEIKSKYGENKKAPNVLTSIETSRRIITFLGEWWAFFSVLFFICRMVSYATAICPSIWFTFGTVFIQNNFTYNQNFRFAATQSVVTEICAWFEMSVPVDSATFQPIQNESACVGKHERTR